MKILMVCLGNICRSPLADGLLRRKVRENNLPVEVDSAGTSGFHAGQAPDHRMIEISEKHGTPLAFLRARPFSTNDFKHFDHIFVMDENNYNDVLSLAKDEQEANKVKFILNEVHPDENREVPDPYYGTWEDFEYVYDLLDQATDRIITKIKQNEY